jgi:UDP-glucose 4-epimerase
MKILVTGGAGFIGSHVADAMLAAGHEVHIMDDLSGGRRENLPKGAAFHELDIRSEKAAALMEREKFDLLCHHAAQMDVRRSVADPGFDAEVNVLGFLNLMEAGRKAGLKKVTFSSTGGAIYGEPVYAPQDENHPLNPLSPYGITKRVTEHYLYFYELTYGIRHVALRYANVYGPRQNPHGEAGVVAIFSERLLKGEKCFINGAGTQTRDYVYVGDVVRANMAALDHEGSAIFNIGTGIETDVNTLFRHIRDLSGSSAPETHAEAKPGEQMRSVLSYAKAEKELGWTPRTALKEGLGETVAWFKKRLG